MSWFPVPPYSLLVPIFPLPILHYFQEPHVARFDFFFLNALSNATALISLVRIQLIPRSSHGACISGRRIIK
jgi:hypothetical protein